MIPLVESEETPMIAPITLLPETGFPLNRRTFYLLAGLDEQSRALAHFAKQRAQSDGGIAIVAPRNPLSQRLVSGIEDESKKLGIAIHF